MYVYSCMLLLSRQHNFFRIKVTIFCSNYCLGIKRNILYLIDFIIQKSFYLSNSRVLQPFTLGLLIQYFGHDSGMTKNQAYAYASGLVLLTFFHSLLKHHIDLSTLEIGMRLRIACSSLIYRKVMLKLILSDIYYEFRNFKGS